MEREDEREQSGETMIHHRAKSHQSNECIVNNGTTEREQGTRTKVLRTTCSGPLSAIALFGLVILSSKRNKSYYFEYICIIM